MQNYRKIWESCYGAIPVDKYGRRFDIHHIDGNRSNNSISNLKAISIQEHYQIHHSQGDWGACVLIKKRLNLSKEEIKFIIQKRSESRKGTITPEETKQKIKSALTGRRYSTERINRSIEGKRKSGWLGKGALKAKGIKRSNGHQGLKHTEETKRKIGEANSKALKGKKKGPLSEETKKKISEARTGTFSTDKTRSKISESKKGKPWTEARRLAQKNKIK